MRYLMAALAVLTCPCHLPILLAVLGGTAAGAALSQYVGLALVAMTLLFLASAWAAIRLFAGQNRTREETGARRTR